MIIFMIIHLIKLIFVLMNNSRCEIQFIYSREIFFVFVFAAAFNISTFYFLNFFLKILFIHF